MTTYEPYGTWPRHDNDAWNTTYDEAKERGWQLRTHSNHGTSYLVCPTGDCKLGPIFSTAKGTEAVAKDSLRDVRTCPHSEAEQQTRAQRTKEHLRWGEIYADAACGQLDARAARDSIEDLWQEADRQADAADEALHTRDDDEILNDIQVTEWWAEHHDEEAQNILAETDLAGTTDPTVVTKAAEESAEAAAVALADVSQRHADYAPLEARLETLRATNDAIRVRIDDRCTDT